MAEITPAEIQRLRQASGVGMMDAKKALTDANGDFDKAFELLRERGQAKMAKRADREASEGAIGSYIHYQSERPVIGALVELACETDFVAKSEEFRTTADAIALHISWSNPGWVTRDAVDDESLDKEREMARRQAEAEGKPAEVIDRIVAGKLEAWYSENVLYEQKFVNPERFDGTVGDMVGNLATKMGENISVRRMARLAIGG